MISITKYCKIYILPLIPHYKICIDVIPKPTGNTKKTKIITKYITIYDTSVGIYASNDRKARGAVDAMT